MSKISITRGLAELKVLTSRISKVIEQSRFISIRKGDVAPHGFKTDAEFTTFVRSSEDKINALKKRYRDIKCKVILSNAVTKVIIAKEEMTVAEAIEYKTSIMFDRMHLTALQNQYIHSTDTLTLKDIQVEERLDELIASNFGKEGKVKREDYQAIAEPFMKQNKWSSLDPIDVKNKIDVLSQRIEDFELEVDFVLSESNAKTEIEVE